MSRGREQHTVWVVVHSQSPSRLSFKPATVLSRLLRLCCVHLQKDQDTKIPVWHAFVSTLQCTSVQSYCCSHSLPDRQVHKFTLCSVSLFMSPYMWLQGLLVPTPHSLQQSAERKGREAKEVKKKKNRLEHFSWILSFFIWSARSCWTTNQKCATEKEKTTKHRQELCIPASTRKSPILGQSRQLSLAHLLSFERLYLSADSVVGFINEILMAMFLMHISDCSARASFSNKMSSRQIWQVELRHQHIEVN